jgi:plastocyanin/ketosteroid isomerase-like protein
LEGRKMFRVLFLGPLFIVALFFAACSTEVRDPVTLANDYVAAYNAGDLTALASTYYTEDTVFSFGPVGPAGEFDTVSGIAQVLASDAESIAGNEQVTISNVTAEGDTARGNFSLTNDGLLQSGLAPITGTFELVARDGKIASITATADEASQQKMAAAMGSRELTVLIGAGQGPVTINEFFPNNVRIRAGDTIVWKQNSSEVHNVSFSRRGQHCRKGSNPSAGRRSYRPHD